MRSLLACTLLVLRNFRIISLNSNELIWSISSSSMNSSSRLAAKIGSIIAIALVKA